MRKCHIHAGALRELRARLRVSQLGMASLLGVSRRTIIRGEQRGMEAAYFSDTIDRWELCCRISRVSDTYSSQALASICCRALFPYLSPVGFVIGRRW